MKLLLVYLFSAVTLKPNFITEDTKQRKVVTKKNNINKGIHHLGEGEGMRMQREAEPVQQHVLAFSLFLSPQS